jgi:hypothetical protein
MKFIYFMFVALFFAATLNTNAQELIDIKIVSETDKYPADMPVDVKVTITNTSSSPLKILSYHTPVNGIEHDILSISLDGISMEYIGAKYKRAAPTERDYLTLKPGESISGIASLWNNYDISVSGRYAIQYKTALLSREPDKDSKDVSSNIIYVEIEGREPPPDPDDDEGDVFSIVNGSNEFKGNCTESEKSDLRTAREHALNYADDSYDYLMIGIAGTRYTTWFGANDNSRYSTVRSNFRKIRDAVDNKTFKFYCNCNRNVYAFVRPRQEYKIHLCDLFWSAPMTGTDSKAGTLIHEVSHFKVVADTDDIAYGQTNAMNLANTNPGNAIKNADNHEYFAEATPYSPYNPCAPTVYYFTGAQINATWDGANCYVLPVPAGTSPFIYNNGYYTNELPGTSCPAPSWYDGANCYILPYPAWSTTYFVWSGNLYLTPGPGNACPSPSWYDGANCYVMPLPSGSSPFKYANNLYITPPPYCPLGFFDGANCYIGTAPSSRTAFIWGNAFYYHH